MPLIDRADSLLSVVDAQPGFYAHAAVHSKATFGLTGCDAAVERFGPAPM
jgi:hypothetical protein